MNPTRRTQARQQGYVMIIVTMALLVASVSAGTIFISGLFRMDRNAHVNELLARQLAREAKLAIIGYAAANVKQPGALPCPDPLGKGEAVGCDVTSTSARLTGCLPWRSLGLERGTDESGAPLFYSISTLWQNALSASARVASGKARLNPDIPPTITTSSGTPVAAAIIAPGQALASQDRSGVTPLTSCSGGFNNQLFEGLNTSWLGAIQVDTSSATFSDRIVSISRDEVFRPLLIPVLSAFMNSSDTSTYPGGKGLPYFFASYSPASLQKPVPGATGQQSGLILNRSVAPNDLDKAFLSLHDYSTGSQFDSTTGCVKEKGIGNMPADWLCLNDWYAYIDYMPVSSGARLVLPLDRTATSGKGWQCQLSVSTISSDSLSCTSY